jgi:hypothetical protein
MIDAHTEILNLVIGLRQHKARMQHIAAEEGDFLAGFKLQQEINVLKEVEDEIERLIEKTLKEHGDWHAAREAIEIV